MVEINPKGAAELNTDHLREAISLHERQIAWSQSYWRGLTGMEKERFDRKMARERECLNALTGNSAEVVLADTNAFVIQVMGMDAAEYLDPDSIHFYHTHKLLIKHHINSGDVRNKVILSEREQERIKYHGNLMRVIAGELENNFQREQRENGEKSLEESIDELSLQEVQAFMWYLNNCIGYKQAIPDGKLNLKSLQHFAEHYNNEIVNFSVCGSVICGINRLLDLIPNEEIVLSGIWKYLEDMTIPKIVKDYKCSAEDAYIILFPRPVKKESSAN